jgi:hypothetical protein
MARRLSESGSRIEDQLWQRRLIELINERLARRNDDTIESALDELASVRDADRTVEVYFEGETPVVVRQEATVAHYGRGARERVMG